MFRPLLSFKKFPYYVLRIVFLVIFVFVGVVFVENNNRFQKDYKPLKVVEKSKSVISGKQVGIPEFPTARPKIHPTEFPEDQPEEPQKSTKAKKEEKITVPPTFTDAPPPKPAKSSEFPHITWNPGYEFLSDTKLSPQNNLYLSDYKLHYCKIDKNAGTALQAVFCYLYNPMKYANFFAYGSWAPGLFSKKGRICANQTHTGVFRKRTVAVASADNFFQRDDILHFAVIRDPIERFVSAWLDICIRRAKYNDPEWVKKHNNYCFGCEDNLYCFILSNYGYISQKAKGGTVKRVTSDWHFYPQSWYCNFDKYLPEYKLLLYQSSQNFTGLFDDLLGSRGVSERLRININKVLSKKKTTHKTDAIKRNAILEAIYSDETLLKLLYSTYYNDYQYFGFKMTNV